MLMLRLSAAFTALSAAVALAGCATTVEQRGNLPPPDEIGQIHPGKTTKDEVAKILGTPSSVGVFDDNSWYYISRRTSQFSFLDPKAVDQQVYIVDFNDQNVVKAVDHKTLKDGKEIPPDASCRFSNRLSAISVSSTAARRLAKAVGVAARLVRTRKARSNRRACRSAAGSTRPFCQYGQQQQRYDVGDLDHRVDRGPRRVLVG